MTLNNHPTQPGGTRKGGTPWMTWRETSKHENILWLCFGGQLNIPVPAYFWNIRDWQRTRQECQNESVASKGQTLLWRIVNRNNIRRTVTAAGWWSLEQDLVAGAGLESCYKTGSHWIGDCWCRNGICWCRKVVAGSGLVSAGSGRWSQVQDWYLLVQEGGCWFRTGSCWCKKVVAGSGLVAVGTGRWLLVQDWYLLVQNL